jgi:predicted dehydrogenase
MKSKDKIRVGIAGLDHFYIGLGALQDLQMDSGAELIILAHRDIDRAKQTAAQYGAQWTTNYDEVLETDIDVLVTACPTSVNANLVIAAAERGLHILSVKPFAMNLDEANKIVNAVERSGIYFMAYDASFRLDPLYQKVNIWLKDGSLGLPLSVYCYFRTVLPDIAWVGMPISRSQTWWLDPEQVPGGAWLDHGIYMVDLLRWLFDSEIHQISGLIDHLRYPKNTLEDFGTSTLIFQNNTVATIESTWLTEFPGMTTGFHLTCSNGQLINQTFTKGIMYDLQQNREVKIFNYSDQIVGWRHLDIPLASGGLMTHMLKVLRGEEKPIADVRDAYANLDACLTFYKAAEKRSFLGL